MDDLNKLILEDINVKDKYYIFLNSIKYLRKVESLLSYQEYINELLPVIEKNVQIFEENGFFLEEYLHDYIVKYDLFWKEYMKYQVWLLGNPDNCKVVNNYKTL